MSKSTLLKVNQLKLSIHLGWSEKERKHEQQVALSFTIDMPTPKACLTDELTDTVCYDALIKKIQAHVKNKEYRLIEYFSQDMYQLVKSELPKKSQLQITVTKKPKIAAFNDTVSFTYGDN